MMYHARKNNGGSHRSRLWLAVSAVVGLMFTLSCVSTGEKTGSSSGGAGKPLKIYILAGQSNMQGQAQVKTVPRMALSPESKPLHDKILDKEGEPLVYKNVSIVYFTGGDVKRGVQRELQVRKGLLAAGSTGSIGPELGFGITMGEAVDQPILIIKTAWGGKSLYRNFRPPSADLMPFEPPKPGRRSKQLPSEKELEKMKKEFEEEQGAYYRLMMKLIKEVLDDPGKYSDAYDRKLGYEIAGFGWFQGYNDAIAGKASWYQATEDRPQFAAYSDLLAHFIRDVRKDLNAPKMPFAIGVMGVGGKSNASPNTLAFRKAMAAPADMPEFKGNVMAVETAGFWDDEMVAALERVSKANSLWNESEHWTEIGKPPREKRTWHYTSFDLDPEKQYRDLEKGEKGDIRTLTGELPKALKNWLNPDFDTSKWQKGPAPIGKAVWGGEPRNKKDEAKREEMESKIRSPWGAGNMLLMKTTFELDRSDIAAYRLCLQSTRSFLVYLNGHCIKNYPWWQHDRIRKWDVAEEDAKHFEQGANELALYGNIEERHGSMYNIVDLYFEGLPKKAADAIIKQQNAIASPRDHALARGRSHQAYHYLGSAYTYSLVGEALARAVIDMGGAK